MGLTDTRPQYTQVAGFIALSAGLTVILSSFFLWNTVQPEIVPSVNHLFQALIALPAASGLLMVVVGFGLISRKQTQKAGENFNKNRFRRIFEAAAIGIGLDDLDGTILESNPKLQSMLGYSHDELNRMSFAQFTHPDDIAADVALFEEMIAGRRESYQVEKRHLRRDGTAQWIRMTNSLVRNEQNQPEYTIAVVEDITSLKQAQERVQLYADIVRRMQIGLLVWHLEDLNEVTTFRLVECNPAAREILQMNASLDQLPGKLLTEVFPELLETAFPKIYKDVITSGSVRDLGEVRYGETPIKVFATKAFPLPNQCVGLIFEDITERKQAEDALQHSEARFRVIAETASCAFMVYQGNRLHYVNSAMEAITEYSQDELTQIPFWELAHPDFRGLVRDRGLARQRGEDVPRRYEVKILTKSGKERWVDITAGSAYLNGKPAAVATAYDITDRKEAEAQLQLAADRERLLSETALRIRSSLNLDEILNTTVAEVRKFLQADRVFIVRLGSDACQTVAESVGVDWLPVLGWVTEQDGVEEIRQLFQPDSVRVVNDTTQIEKTPFLQEYYDRCQVKAGMGVPIVLDDEMFGVLIVNQCSATRHWQPFEIDLLKKLGTQVEIALQQGQLYQQLQRLASNLECQVEERTLELKQRMQELQSLNQVKDILLHAVTHDLRTPMQGMLMVLNHLRNKSADTVSIPRSMLDCIIESSDRQLSLLNSLMETHSNTECKKQILAREPLSLKGVLENALAILDEQLQKNQAIVINKVTDDLFPVAADAHGLQFVLENLILNAVKHNPPGRTICLNAFVSKDCKCSTPIVCFSVEDDGIGMSAEQCDRLFQLYIRGLNNRHLTGIGLGLHRSLQIIEAHGGKMGVESQPQKGSKFWFTLPLEKK